MPLPMFLPINETGQSVTLPGLAPDPGGARPLFTLDMVPIPASGEYAGTLWPLADPTPIQGMPLPPEVSPVAMPSGASPGGIPPVQLPMPFAPEMPNLPGMAPAELSAAPLGDPLPTSVMAFQQAWPPFPEPTPQVPLIPPGMAPIPDVGYAPPSLTPLPDVRLPGPAMPTLPGEPLTGAATQGWGALLDALASVRGQQQDLRDFTQGRSILRAPVPEPNTGQVIWQQHFGADR